MRPLKCLRDLLVGVAFGIMIRYDSEKSGGGVYCSNILGSAGGNSATYDFCVDLLLLLDDTFLLVELRV
jgi:hypothetical protein